MGNRSLQTVLQLSLQYLQMSFEYANYSPVLTVVHIQEAVYTLLYDLFPLLLDHNRDQQ